MRRMRPRFLAIVLVALSACVAPPPRPLHSKAGHLLAWCSGTLRDAAGTPAWTPPGSYLVEILPDGTVRDVHNGAVSGRPGPRALHLFASTDVSVHMGAIDGPVIATASPGVAFTLVAYGEEVSEVAFGPSDKGGSSPRVFVRTADLALEVKKTPLPEVPPAPTLLGMVGSLHVTPGGAQIGDTSCFGPVRLLEEKLEPLSRQRWLHVQIINQLPYDRKAPRLVLSGWMKRDELRAAPECGTALVLSHPDIPDERTRALLPPGFIERARPAAAPLVDGGSVHWLTSQGDCVEARRSGKKLTLSEPLGDLLYVVEYGYEHSPELGLITLFGPNFMKIADNGRGEVVEGGGYACGNQYMIVGASADGIAVLHNVHLHAREPWALWAYRPADTEVWYSDKARCEQAAARSKAPADSKVGNLPRPHGGC